MRAGQLDRRVTIQRATETNTGDGLIPSWATIATLWASRKDASDGERIAAGTILSTVVARFVVRSSTTARGILPRDRLIEGGSTFEVTGIKEIGRREALEITAEARLE